jgi:hypothetical protein
MIEIIKKPNQTKALGDDVINNKMLKILPNNIIVYLQHILQPCINITYFSIVLIMAKIAIFHKPGKDYSLTENHPPTSRIQTLNNLTWRLILNILQSHLDSLQFFQSQQFCFREHHSITHQLIRMTHEMCDAFEFEERVAGPYLDITKAFDRLWHKRLIFKLFFLYIPGNITHILPSSPNNHPFYA